MSKEGGFTFSNPGFTNPPGGPSAPNYQPPPQPSAYQQSGFPPTGPPPPYPGESSGGFPNQAPNFSSNSQTFTHNTSSFNQSGNTFTHNTSSYTNTGNTFTHSATNQTSNVVITTRPTHVSVTRRNAMQQQRNRKICAFFSGIIIIAVFVTVAAVGLF